MKSTVGVLIPMYNGADFIHQALASVAAQSRPVDQVVVIDDCSTDDSLMRVKEWSDRLPLTVIEFTTNSGVSEARNAGLAALNTDLVALLDADDVWLPDHVELSVNAHETCGGIISAGAFIWYPGGALRPYNKHLRLEVPPPHRQLGALLERNFVFVSSMVELSELHAVGGFRPDTIEDWDLWVRLVARGLTVTQIERATVLYRRHPGNASRRRSVIIEQEIQLLLCFRRELPARYNSVIDRSLRHRRSELLVARHLEDGEFSGQRLPLSLMGQALRGDWRSRMKASALWAAPGMANRMHKDRS